MKKNNFKQHRTLILAMLGILIMLGISHGLYHLVINHTDNTPADLSVQTIVVKEISLPIRVDTVGSLRPMTEVKLKAGGVGHIKILVEAGSWVKKGTPLVTVTGFNDIPAPFDGHLTEWKVKEGEFVSAGTELVDIINTQILSLHYRLPEEYAPKLDLGQVVVIAVRAFPNREFTGKVTFISPTIDKKTHTILLHALIDNPDQALWSGMSAHIHHILSIEPKALIVPEACLILTLQGHELLVIQEGKLVRRTVEVGTRYQGRAHIMSGVKEGEMVLLTQTDDTQEGAAVTPSLWQGDW
jgi:multidrug efflux pump subunit AcrA (membrane-fusion protein)